MQKTILLVDDEAAILRALNRLLRRAGFTVFTANSGQEALEVLQRENIQVVLSDFRMPHMTGGELLAKVKEEHQNIVGLVLSGFADLESVTKILNDGSASKFLHKPWDDSELLQQIEWAFEHWSTLNKQSGLTRMVMESDEALLEIDAAGIVRNLNPAAMELCSATENDVLNNKITDFIYALSPRQLDLLCTQAENSAELVDGDNLYEVTCHPLGNERWILSARHKSRNSGLGVKNLLHRSEVMRRLEDWMSTPDHNTSDAETGVSVIYLDVNRFQTFNDSLGYREADRLLAEIARTLIEQKPQDAMIGRMTGDEFVFILPTVRSDQHTVALINQILEPFDRPIGFAERKVYISFSAAYALAPEDGSCPEELLRNAKSAAAYSKRRGRSVHPRYKPAMNQRTSELMTIQSDLYRALEKNQFSVVFQPKVSLKTGRILGAESLLRWKHDTLGFISPATFIPLAEDNGLIDTIGEWVLATSATQSKIWQMDGLPPFRLAVNLSGRQLQEEGLLDAVKVILTNTGIEPNQLELEVTETFMMQDIEHSLQLLKELKSLGIRLALDDFGTGYSSLNYLSRLPVDTLKIDRSFVTDLENSQERLDLVRNVIRMSHDLGMEVVAEGVETQAQFDLLAEVQCDEVQGYFISPPVPADKFRDLLENQPLIGRDFVTPAPETMES